MKRLFITLFIIAPISAPAFNSGDYTAFTERTVHHQNSEICVLPNIPSIGSYTYSKKDLKNDRKLCALGHYEKNAVCEKLWSSFPAIEYFKIKTGEIKSDLEKRCSKRAGQKTSLKKLAKFKYGTSCSRTSSILGYYHVARILGIKHIPNAVIRTMDKRYHLKRANAGATKAAKPNYNELIAKTWRSLKSTLNKDPRDKRRGRYLLSQDSSHSYGAISKNPRGEHFYGKPFYHGAGADTGVKRFASRSEAYNDLKKSTLVSDFIGTEINNGNFQRLQQMKDASELIILDTLFAQRDRIGNLHFYDYFIFTKKGGSLSTKKMTSIIKKKLNNMPEYTEKLAAIKTKYARKSKSNKKAKRLAQVKLVSEYLTNTYGAVAHAKHMIMKDNDCGFKGGNTWKSLKLIEKINHINQKVYTQLMSFHNFIFNNPESKQYLKIELAMFDEEIKTFKENLRYTASSLNRRCISGDLKTDLNIKDHFNSTNTGLSCGDELKH